MEMKKHWRDSANKLPRRLICYLVVLACLSSLTVEAADNEKCPNTPQCICKWSGGKRMADCSNAGNQIILTYNSSSMVLPCSVRISRPPLGVLWHTRILVIVIISLVAQHTTYIRTLYPYL